ncbi:helix-turn-helix domain-containing protein [Kribbella sp. NPDC056861]|uniref:GlxA family transcriptional regulator n=1 Tax=Kribbella sp. NPDC056861 TaxID=3154857 RepID=UPI0034169BD3
MEKVALLVFDGVRVFEFAVAAEVWGLDRTARGVPGFDFTICGPDPSGHTLDSGLTCTPQASLDALQDSDLVVVPGVEDPLAQPPDAVLTALRAAHDRGTTIAALCSGTFILAAAGLLDGKRATAHWQDSDLLAARYPSVQVDQRPLYVGDSNIWTSAGTAAGIDLCLHLVRRRHGAAAAATIARTMVTAPFRPGGQAQFISQPVPLASADEPLAELQTRMLADLAHPWTITELAAHASMSERTLARRFADSTGTTPLRWLIDQRVIAAQERLESTSESIAAIARSCGFGTPLSLRQHFTRRTGLTPHNYRNTFGQRHEVAIGDE